MVLDGIEKAFHPYVKDRGLDWEIHIEQVSCYMYSSASSPVVAAETLGRGKHAAQHCHLV